MEIYEGTDYYGNSLDTIKRSGIYFQLLFLLINLILMLNFVIAILSSTYSKFQPIMIGLYYNVLCEQFPYKSWDDRYGAMICAYAPFNLILLTISPYLLLKSELGDHEKLIKANEDICLVLYLPVLLFSGTMFFLGTVVSTPVAYGIHCVRLFSSILQ
jgi:hypothetical protein